MRLCIKPHRQKPFVPLTASAVYVKSVQIFLFILHAVAQCSSIGQVLTGYSLAYCITVQTAVLGVEMDGYVLLITISNLWTIALLCGQKLKVVIICMQTLQCLLCPKSWNVMMITGNRYTSCSFQALGAKMRTTTTNSIWGNPSYSHSQDKGKPHSLKTHHSGKSKL